MDEDDYRSDRPMDDGPALAFEQLRGEVASVRSEVSLLRAAIEGLTAARDNIEIPNYEPTLQRTEKILMTLLHQIEVLSKKPAMTVTPETMGQRLNAAVSDATRELQHQIQSAKEALAGAARNLETMVVSARRGDEQNRWLLWAGLGGLVLGLLFHAVMAGPIARLMPASWQWPESMATQVLGEPTTFDAGQHLMRAANADGWRAIVVAANLVKDNRETIDRCRERAAKAKKAQRCTIEVRMAE